MDYDPENPICIIQRQSDGTFAYAHEGEVIELGNTLPGAVNALDARGIIATHWLPKGAHATMSLIASSIVRDHLSDEQREEIRSLRLPSF
ncbi:hypothetical protein G6L37_06360 [Agrobacterium rubi]|nr:hypothetical protein [Agrobacterium rubi]NTF24985.1 hypothetical protein [Agrobacterium rubi]